MERTVYHSYVADAMTSIVKWAVYWQPCDWCTDQYCKVGSVLTAMWLMWCTDQYCKVGSVLTAMWLKRTVYHSYVADALTSIVKWAVYWHSHVTDALTSIVKWAVYWQPCDWCTDQYCKVGSVLTAMWLMWCTDQYCKVGSVLTAMWLMHWPVLWSGQCADSHVTDALTSIVRWAVYWQPCDWCTDQDCEVGSVLT